MILPKNILEGFSYYKENTIPEKMSNHYTLQDEVVIHFNQWWKRKKTFVFSRTKIYKDGVGFWESDSQRDELITQLRAIQAGTWMKIPPKLYLKLQESNPEFFL